MKQWPSVIVPLNTGVDESDADNSGHTGIVSAINVDFGKRGAVRPRPGSYSSDSFVTQTVNSVPNTVLDPTVYALSDLTGTAKWARQSSFTIRSSGLEQPALLLKGRVMAYDGVRWLDRLGSAAATARRGGAIRTGINAGLATLSAPSDEKDVSALATDFGYDGHTTAKTSMVLVDAAGAVSTRVVVTHAMGPGSSARCGTLTAMIHVPIGTNNLVLTTRSNGALALTQTLVANDAGTPAGRGANPVICCDNNSTVFYVTYVDSIGRIVLIRMTTAGAITDTYIPSTIGGVINGCWVTNSTIANDAVTLVYTGSNFNGCRSIVRTMAALGVKGAAVTDGAVPGAGPVVCGASRNAAVYYAWVDTDGYLTCKVRSETATATINWFTYEGLYRPTSTPAVTFRPAWYIQHQPIIMSDRILIGICPEASSDFLQSTHKNYGASSCTWTVMDISDMATSANPSSLYRRVQPAMVARGPTEGSCEAWNPQTATVSSAGDSYKFASLDWRFEEAGIASITSIAGSQGYLAMNQVAWLAPQYASFGESTILAGSVPHAIAQGNAHELGWMETRPVFYMAPGLGGLGGSLAAGSYTACVVWRWTDDAGQVHRSEPSIPFTRSAVNLNDAIVVSFSLPYLTEREPMDIKAEVYVTDVNPTSDSPLHLQATIARTTRAAGSNTYTIQAVNTAGLAVYTSGDVLANQTADASGGIVTVGNRCWLSDGISCFASKLRSAAANEAPSWHVDGPLTLDVPSSAGKIVGLSSIEDKLVIFCERGIFTSTGDGPDNTDSGPDFLPVQRLADIGLSAQRAVARTPAGIFFSAAHSHVDSALSGTYGGICLVNPSLSVSYANQRVQESITSGIDEMMFLPERDQLFMQAQQVSSSWPALAIAAPTVARATYVLDLRANQISKWVSTNTTICNSTEIWWMCANGVPWCLADGVFAFEASFGQDGASAYVQTLSVLGIYPGKDDGGWGRIRSLKVLGSAIDTHTLSLSAVLDDSTATLTATDQTMPPSTSATWPTSRYAPEWCLPNQKCTIVTATITATPAEAEWTGLEVQYKSYGRAPARQRS